MFKILQNVAITPFQAEQEKQFNLELNQRARGMMLFIYWAGGLIAFAFMIRAILMGHVGTDLYIRILYLTFWATLTYRTFYSKNTLSFDTSFVIYSIVGTFYTSYIYIVVETNNENLTSSTLLFLIGLLVCQLRAKVMTKVSLAAVIMPVVVMLAWQKVEPSLLSNLLNIVVWAVCCWIASRILEQVNRKIFSYKIQLQESRDKEARANEVKSRFLALMSHEIRTPLTSIIGHSDTKLISAEDRKHMDQSLKIINKNGNHLLSIINDLLDISKLEAGKLNYEVLTVSIPDLLDECMELVEVLVEKKGLLLESNITWPIPETIDTDPTRLKQVLLNLLNNAIKFTDSGKVDVHTQFKQGQLVISVSDSGIGMEETEMKKLFHLFTQTDQSTTRKFGGTGLGLYLSQQIAKGLHGSIEVTSEKNVGSCFTLSITPSHFSTTPLVKAPEQKKEAEIKKSGAMHGKVLVVEDYADNRHFVCGLLRHNGLEVDEAENGQVAVEKALTESFDLILMDIQMPLMGGEEALKLLHTAGCDTPIVALTANAQKSEQESYLAQGFTACLSKPIENQIFFDTIGQFLSSDNKAPTQTFDSSDLKRKYVKSLPMLELELTQAKETGDMLELQSLSHKIKGSAAQFDLPTVGHAAAILEKQIPINSPSKIDECYDALINEIRRFIEVPS